MAGDWREVTLADVSEDITVGHVGLMADRYVDVGVPFLRSLNVEPFGIKTDDLKYINRDFHAQLRKSALKPGDVVIVRTVSRAHVPSFQAGCRKQIAPIL